MKKTTKDEYFQSVYKVVHYIIYLVAIIDWYSKKILSYRVSNSMDKSFCIEALSLYPKPKIFNTDQGMSTAELK